jgi:hypothetical protein
MGTKQPAPIELVTTAKFEIDTTIHTEDVTNAMRSDTEEILFAARAETQKLLDAAKKEHGKLECQLEEQGEELIAKQKASKNAKAAAKAISTFMGEKEYEAEVDPKSTDVNIERKQVRYTVGIWLKKAKRESWDSAVVDHKFHVDFSADMKKTVKNIEKAAEQVVELEGKLQEICTAIAELDRFERRVKAAMTKATMRGELSTTDDVMNVAESVKPAILTKLLPAPPA